VKTSGIGHLIFTISEDKQSREFYGDFLGFEINNITDLPDGGFYFIVGDVFLYFIPSLKPIAGDRFSEFRIGLDHLSFSAPDEGALHDLADNLISSGVDTQGVEVFELTGNMYVAFRDPDNIQLEYWLEK
jgi:catechol 2,3-dioxygenase-like lactoylglutathione lyase family enzyme